MTLRGSKGFSLVEALFAAFLSFLTLSSIAYTLKQASQARTTLKETGIVSEIYHATSLIRGELVAVEQLIEPIGGEASRLQLRLIVPSSILSIAERPTVGDPYLPDERVEVTYQLVDGMLRRLRVGSDFSVDDVLFELEDFQVRHLAGQDLLELNFTVQNERRARTYTTLVRIRP